MPTNHGVVFAELHLIGNVLSILGGVIDVGTLGALEPDPRQIPFF